MAASHTYAPAASPAPLKLGLIGDHILESRSPDLHRIAGRLAGFAVTYDLLIPARMGMDFDTVFDACRAAGMRGLNITYPYKERVLARIAGSDPLVRSLGSVNTVVFKPEGPIGYNTDHSGFIAAYRGRFGSMEPGIVVLVGAGGVGRAIAFALATLRAERLLVVDRDGAKAEGVVSALKAAFGSRLSAEAWADISAAMGTATGVVNCTPVGMSGNPGSAVPAAALAGCRWAFDAVYTPVETQFMADCGAAGVAFLSGYELFFHQGVDAFRIFSGTGVGDLDLLRKALATGAI